jgi:hypothetical protein
MYVVLLDFVRDVDWLVDMILIGGFFNIMIS